MKKTLLTLVLLSQALALPVSARVSYKCPTLDRDHISQLAIAKTLHINRMVLTPLNDASRDIMKSATQSVSDIVAVAPKDPYDDVNGVCVYALTVNGTHHGDASIKVRADN